MKNTLWALSIFCLLSFVSAKRAQSQTPSQPTAAPAAAETNRPAAEPVEICLAPASVK